MCIRLTSRTRWFSSQRIFQTFLSVHEIHIISSLWYILEIVETLKKKVKRKKMKCFEKTIIQIDEHSKGDSFNYKRSNSLQNTSFFPLCLFSSFLCLFEIRPWCRSLLFPVCAQQLKKFERMSNWNHRADGVSSVFVLELCACGKHWERLSECGALHAQVLSRKFH